MPARIRSSVLLPLPFGPTTPKNSPRSTENVTSLQRLVPLVRHPAERMEEVLLEVRPLLVRDPERLRDPGDLDRGDTSEPLREVAALAPEEHERDDEEERRRCAIGMSRPPTPA